MEHLNLRHLIVSFTSLFSCFVYFLDWLAQIVLKHTGKKPQETLGYCNIGDNFNHYKHCISR